MAPSTIAEDPCMLTIARKYDHVNCLLVDNVYYPHKLAIELMQQHSVARIHLHFECQLSSYTANTNLTPKMEAYTSNKRPNDILATKCCCISSIATTPHIANEEKGWSKLDIRCKYTVTTSSMKR